MERTLARLTVLDNGVVRVSLAHDDGTGPQVMTAPDGTVQTLEVEEDGSRILTIHTATDEIEAVKFVESGPLVAAEEQSSFGGPFVEVTRPIKLPDGREGTVTISKDASGHEWQSGKVPQSIDKSGGYGTPARTWIVITHPPNDLLHPSSHRGGESVELGRDRYTKKNGEHIDSNYTIVRTHERDSMGRDTSVSVRSAYSPDTGREEHSSAVRADDGTRSWTNVTRGQDGSWSIVTVTVDKDGKGTKHITEGKGDEVTHDETTDAAPSDAGPDDGNGGDSGSDPDPDNGSDEDSRADPDPDQGSSSAPTGDGEQTSEGNPDGALPFDAVELARLLGDDWNLGDGIDTLGDLDRALRPWIDRIIAAARHDVGGAGQAEALDALGAPPPIEFALTGYEQDELADHDSLGRPRPIFGSLVEIDSAVTAAERTGQSSRSAIATAELVRIAHGFSYAASTVNRAPGRLATS